MNNAKEERVTDLSIIMKMIDSKPYYSFSNIITLGLTSPAHLQATQASPRMFLSFGLPPFALLKCLQSGENQARPTGCPSHALTGSTAQTFSQ